MDIYKQPYWRRNTGNLRSNVKRNADLANQMAIDETIDNSGLMSDMWSDQAEHLPKNPLLVQDQCQDPTYRSSHHRYTEDPSLATTPANEFEAQTVANLLSEPFTEPLSAPIS